MKPEDLEYFSGFMGLFFYLYASVRDCWETENGKIHKNLKKNLKKNSPMKPEDLEYFSGFMGLFFYLFQNINSQIIQFAHGIYHSKNQHCPQVGSGVVLVKPR